MSSSHIIGLLSDWRTTVTVTRNAIRPEVPHPLNTTRLSWGSCHGRRRSLTSCLPDRQKVTSTQRRYLENELHPLRHVHQCFHPEASATTARHSFSRRTVSRYSWNNLYLVGLPRLFLKHLGVAGLQHPHDAIGWSPVDVTGQGVGLLRNRKWRFIIWGLGHRKYQMTTPTQWLYCVNLKFNLKSRFCGMVFVFLTKIRSRDNMTNFKISMFSN